jgi:hypothetical protein
MMEGWDLDKVKELKAQYEAAGVTSTTSYRFLDSLVHAGQPPRGGGIAWLQQLLDQGAPSDIGAVAARAEQLAAEMPTFCLGGLSASILRRGRVEEWQRVTLDEAEAALAKGWRTLTPDEIRILSMLYEVGHARSNWWWSSRTAVWRRFLAIEKVITSGTILQADFEFMVKHFGPAYRELTKPTFKLGDLVRVRDIDGKDLGRGVISSEPKIRYTHVAYDVIVSDRGLITAARDNIMKRLK